MTKLIMFLIRKRLGLKKGEHFRFANQKSPYDEYWFTDTKLLKKCSNGVSYYTRLANVKLNYIVDKKCKIVKVGDM